jgi:myo-inositol-1(or 4)-monophosphatase
MSLNAREQPAADDIALAPDKLRKIEETAVELAKLAGAEIVNALGRTLTIRYKSVDPVKLAQQLGTLDEWRDPVSEVDQKVEHLIRERLTDRFPEHDILGEEISDATGRENDFIWAVDPIDGTTNFINGFPMFAASIGVLYRGRPVVGAVWCSVSHALYAGIYHARLGGDVYFDGEAMQSKPNPGIRRRLAGEPHALPDLSLPWEIRKTGSAAIECAFVAAGLLRVARFERPNIWDVAGGMALVLASGGVVHSYANRTWAPFTHFEAPPASDGGMPVIRNWHRPILIGDAEGVEMLRAMNS